MSWLRNRIRRWLDVPTCAEARSLTLREMDADRIWNDSDPAGKTFQARRRDLRIAREVAIGCGSREDTRV